MFNKPSQKSLKNKTAKPIVAKKPEQKPKIEAEEIQEEKKLRRLMLGLVLLTIGGFLVQINNFHAQEKQAFEENRQNLREQINLLYIQPYIKEAVVLRDDGLKNGINKFADYDFDKEYEIIKNKFARVIQDGKEKEFLQTKLSNPDFLQPKEWISQVVAGIEGFEKDSSGKDIDYNNARVYKAKMLLGEQQRLHKMVSEAKNIEDLLQIQNEAIPQSRLNFISEITRAIMYANLKLELQKKLRNPSYYHLQELKKRKSR